MVRFTEDHRLEDFTFVGHSMGGKVGVLLGCNYPGLVRRIVLLDIAPTNFNHLRPHWV
jgi:esterase